MDVLKKSQSGENLSGVPRISIEAINENTDRQEFKTAGQTEVCSGTYGHQRALSDALLMPRAEKKMFYLPMEKKD